ncbi:MAG: hypothetical protein EZS28_037044, partial [Streblomastix strix]
MKQSVNAAKVIQGQWKRHKLYEQLQQTLINQRYKRLGEKPFRLIKNLEAKLAQARQKFQEKNEVNIDGLSDELMKSKDKIHLLYELEKAKPYKVYIDFGYVWQKKKQVYKYKQILNKYHYTHTGPSADNSYKTLPNTVVRDIQTNYYFKQKAVDLLSDYQDTNHEDSSTLKVALFSFLTVVYRLPLGTKMDQICQHFNKEGITRNVECDYKICWFIVASFALHPEIYQTRTRVSDAIKLLLQFYDINPSSRLKKANKQLLEQYKDFNYVTDLERYQQLFKLNVVTYTCDEVKHKTNSSDVEQFSKFEEHIIDKDYLTVNVLLVPLSLMDEIHAIFITDIDKVINGKLCLRNCQKIFNTKNQNYKCDLTRHLKYCQGPEAVKQVKLDHLPKPYYLHISSNMLLQKLVATGQSDLLNPTLNYITFDFETVENIINEDNVLAQLEPLSVASAATIN